MEHNEWNPWNMLKDWIVHRMHYIATCKELLYDDLESCEFHAATNPFGIVEPIFSTIIWDSLEDDVMDGE